MAKKTTTQLYANVVSPELKRMGKRIDILREKAGYSKSALAIESEISQFYLHRIINGTCKVSIPILQKIAKTLKVKVSDMIPF